jgi:hypothetical protein
MYLRMCFKGLRFPDKKPIEENKEKNICFIYVLIWSLE